jgi:uncharacterized membrane protein
MAPPKRKLVTFPLPLYAFTGLCTVMSFAAPEDTLISTGVTSALWLLGAIIVAVMALVSDWFAVLATKHWTNYPAMRSRLVEPASFRPR